MYMSLGSGERSRPDGGAVGFAREEGGELGENAAVSGTVVLANGVVGEGSSSVGSAGSDRLVSADSVCAISAGV